jgi:hypothetical protein
VCPKPHNAAQGAQNAAYPGQIKRENGRRYAAAVDPTTNPSLFEVPFGPTEVLGRIGQGTVDEIQYTFAEPRAFYLRVMPVAAQPTLKQTKLMEIASQHRPDVLSQYRFAGLLDRNRFGVIAIEGSGTSTTPGSLTQLFVTGEVWGLSTHFFAFYQGLTVVPMVAVENVYRRVLTNYCEILTTGMGIAPPYTVALGAIGLQETHVGLNNGIDGPIHTDSLHLRRVLNDSSKAAQEIVVKEFIDGLLDLAGITRS